MTKRRRTPARPGLDDQRYRRNRLRLKAIGNHTCAWCGYAIDMAIPYPNPLSWTADHIIPRARLDPDDDRNWHIANLQELHRRCNSARGAKPMPIQQLNPPSLTTSMDW